MVALLSKLPYGCTSISQIVVSGTCKQLLMHFKDCTEPIFTVRNEVAKVMFLHLSVILSTGGGFCFSACWDTSPPGTRPPGADPPGSRHPPGADTPQEQTPPRSRPPWSRHPPGADTPQEQIPPPPETDTKTVTLTVHVNEA